MTELELEQRARKLAGERLARVLYQRPARSDADDAWRGPAPHSVGLAVYLECKSKRRVRVGWGDDFGLRHGQGVTLSEVKTIDRDAGEVEDVSDSEAWRDLIGTEI